MSLRITWLNPVERVGHELRQLKEEGVDTQPLIKQWSGLSPEHQAMQAPSLLQEWTALSPSVAGIAEREQFVEGLKAGPKHSFDRDELHRKIQAAWLGRGAGCLLGKPVEKVPREGIRALLESINEYPLQDYFTAQGVPESVAEHYPWNKASRPTSLRENIQSMPEDDDLNYTMLNLSVVERFGPDCTSEHIAQTWLESMPVLTVFTAERVAYINLLAYIFPPQSAAVGNPYREWIGAQIRADLWGYIHPGNPVGAAKAAFRDARISHVENGVFGEMMVAAMVAQAFISRDVGEVVQAGLSTIPADSRLAEAVRFTVGLKPEPQPWEQTLDQLYQAFNHYHWVHTINNAALVVAALLYGQADYQRSITAAVMGGWDTDCNGATVGSIVGAMNGNVPAKWTDPLRNKLRTSLKGFDHSSFDDLAKRTLAVVSPQYIRG